MIYFCVESDVKRYLSRRARGALTHVQALGNHLSDILADEMADMSVIVEQVKDESRRKELRSNDDEEDYLDEGFAFTYTFYMHGQLHHSFSGDRDSYTAFRCFRKERYGRVDK